MKFNLEYYRSFFTVANCRSFTRAAEQLFLTQSAVSQSVRKLEAELGCPLFLRAPGSLTLTKEGTLLYFHVKKAFAELQTGEDEIRRLAKFQAGELTIGATETSLNFLLAPQLLHFRNQHPDIPCTFIGSTTLDVCQKLQSGEVEIAFLLDPIPPGFYFQLTPLRKIQDLLICSSTFPIDTDQTHDLREIAGFPLISVTPDNSVRAYIDNWFLENQLLFTPEFTVRSTGLILPLVRNHLGIGILPSDFAADDMKKGSLVQVKTSSLPNPRTLYLAVNPVKPVSIIGQEFLRFISEQFP